MKLAELANGDAQQLVESSGLPFFLGPYIVNIKSKLPTIADNLSLFYANHKIAESDFADFHITIAPPANIRRWFKPQIQFSFDGAIPFKPLPKAQAYATLEWGLNWCISSNSHQYLVIHAAVIEKNGKAVIMPAQPGAGKSTLTAGLVSQGWRLLSDELTLLTLDEIPLATPIPKPINLKNASIQVIKEFAPDAILGSIVRDTTKGTVTHMKAPKQSVELSGEYPQPRFIVFPKYKAGSSSLMTERAKSRSFLEIAKQSFNFHILGEEGFNVLDRVVTDCNCLSYTYSQLSEAVSVFNELVE